MKKLVAALVVFLVAVAAAAPWVIGFVLEREVRSRLAEVPTTTMIDVSISEYDRGWFSSRIVTGIGFGRIAETIARREAEQRAQQAGVPFDEAAFLEGLEEPEVPPEIAFVTDVRHGLITSLDRPKPVLARAMTRLDPNTPGLSELEDSLGVESTFTSWSVYELSGLVRTALETTPIDVEDEDLRVSIPSARLDSGYSLRSGAVEMRFYFPGAEVSTEAGGGQIDNVRFDLSGRLVEDQLFVGTSLATVEFLEFSVLDAETDANSEIEIADMALESETRVDEGDETLSVRHAWRIDHIDLGPMGSVEEAEIVATIDALDLALMRAWTELSNELALGATPGDATEIVAPLGPALEVALRRSPRLSIAPVRATVNGEAFEFSIRIGIEGEKLGEDPVVDEPLTLLDATNGELAASVPHWAALAIVRNQLEPQAAAAVEQGQVTPDQATAWLEQQSAAMLDQYVLQNVVQLGADGYRILLALDEGVVSVNGQPLPIDLRAMLEAQAATQAP